LEEGKGVEEGVEIVWDEGYLEESLRQREKYSSYRYDSDL